MTLGYTRTLPRWLIDDTTGIADGRVFAVHTQEPHCIGELLPASEVEPSDISMGELPEGQVLCHVNWQDTPDTATMVDMANDLVLAMTHHQGVRDAD
ncbi:MAG: hypothetical protein JKX85_10475 [Phycisphaeraceae bacterium]|nr:hypothetical protein [Phycisphaeraceae bacterium]